MAPACKTCSLSFARQDIGDGPVFFSLVIIGFLAVGLAVFTELRYTPPLWVHAVLWIPFTVIACLLCMRFFSALLLFLQYRNHRDSFDDI